MIVAKRKFVETPFVDVPMQFHMVEKKALKCPKFACSLNVDRGGVEFTISISFDPEERYFEDVTQFQTDLQLFCNENENYLLWCPQLHEKFTTLLRPKNLIVKLEWLEDDRVNGMVSKNAKKKKEKKESSNKKPKVVFEDNSQRPGQYIARNVESGSDPYTPLARAFGSDTD